MAFWKKKKKLIVLHTPHLEINLCCSLPCETKTSFPGMEGGHISMPLALPLLICSVQKRLPLWVSATMVLLPEYGSSGHCLPVRLPDAL